MATVIFFTLFIIASAVNANSEKSGIVTTKTPHPKVKEETISLPDNPDPKLKEEIKMSENGNDGDEQPQVPGQPAEPVPQTPERPDLDIVAPDFDIVTESFDPSKLPNGKAKE